MDEKIHKPGLSTFQMKVQIEVIQVQIQIIIFMTFPCDEMSNYYSFG